MVEVKVLVLIGFEVLVERTVLMNFCNVTNYNYSCKWRGLCDYLALGLWVTQVLSRIIIKNIIMIQYTEGKMHYSLIFTSDRQVSAKYQTPIITMNSPLSVRVLLLVTCLVLQVH